MSNATKCVPFGTYTMDEIEDMAIDGRELPENMNYADALLFLMYRNLYDYAARVQMDMDQGKREKSRILKAHNEYRFAQKMEQYTAQLWINIEQAAIAYRKAQTVGEAIQAADNMMDVLYRMPVQKHFDMTPETAQANFQTFGKTQEDET